MKRLFMPGWVLVCLMGLGAAATNAAEDTTMLGAGPASVVHFLRPDALDLAALLPAPPAPGSLAAQADLEAVLQAQAWRTPEQVAWAKLVAKAEMFAVFGADQLFGPWFTKENLRVTAELFENILADTRQAAASYKKMYPRPRTFVVDARVQPCIDRPDGGSYPSGHATVAYIWAGVLAEIFPERRAELFERAHRAAWGRVLAGVHFPTDLEGSRRLAEATVAELKKSAAFRAAIGKCRAEAAAVALNKAA